MHAQRAPVSVSLSSCCCFGVMWRETVGRRWLAVPTSGRLLQAASAWSVWGTATADSAFYQLRGKATAVNDAKRREATAVQHRRHRQSLLTTVVESLIKMGMRPQKTKISLVNSDRSLWPISSTSTGAGVSLRLELYEKTFQTLKLAATSSTASGA